MLGCNPRVPEYRNGVNQCKLTFNGHRLQTSPCSFGDKPTRREHHALPDSLLRRGGERDFSPRENMTEYMTFGMDITVHPVQASSSKLERDIIKHRWQQEFA
ncbi:hypothetical protein SKAU_G00241990 [Synaphobranchus kaupii]|uniref:Uncharacterized protein n=1 Tax=Synaphobranchus kaupii TaxID=118154 RepID=A0A9Q1F7V7_SYNKA|nr:hypothetical protein SKAU_G00241990 [Synaphobranchus kaupii]